MPFSKPTVTSSGVSGASFGTLREHPDVIGRGVGRVFQFPAFVRDVPDIAVAAVDFRGGLRDRHVVFRRVLDAVFARDQIPFAPRGDHGQLGRQSLIGQLEADLIVALAGAAVRERVASGGKRGFHLAFGEQRPRDRRPEQILVLIDAARADQLPQIVADELFAHVGDFHFGSSGLARFRFEAGQLIAALTDIAAHGDDFATVVFLQPRNDDGCVQPARIGECDFFCIHEFFDLPCQSRTKAGAAQPAASAAAPFAHAAGFPPDRIRPTAAIRSRCPSLLHRAWPEGSA